jgi:signal transduction histidine kinase
MQIRQKLTYQFITIVAFIILSSSVAIYFFSADYRREEFYSRLKSKAENVAKLLIEVEEVDANLLKKIEKDNPTSLPNEKIIIFNYQDTVLYSSVRPDSFRLDKNVLSLIRLEKYIRFRAGKDEVLGFLFTGKYDRFVVVAGATDIYGFNKLKNLRTVLVFVFAASIVIVFITGWVYAGRALKPMSKVISQVDSITISSLNLRVDEGNKKDEIARLAGTFNKMLDRLETAIKMQKNFIAHASHELRTPLTAISGQLEVALMTERAAKEYQSVIRSVLEDIKSLSSISNKLLLLAQASSDASETALRPLRIDDIVWQSRSELLKRNPDYIIEVLFDQSIDDAEELTIKGNEQLIKTVILNLMDNGCKYSSDHKVLVTLSLASRHTILLFTDHGIGIDEDDLKHIFQPFFRGKNVQAARGHGIGLSLAERIVRLHGGTIEVTSMPGKGTSFSVYLPMS